MIKTKTFKNGKAALEHAKTLLAKGEISQRDFDRVKREVEASDPSEEDERAYWHGYPKGD